MRKICLFLFIQASLIAISFQYQNYLTNKYLSQSWVFFLDKELKLEGEKVEPAKAYASRIVRFRKHYKSYNEKLYLLEKNINQALKGIDFNQNREAFQPHVDSILFEFEDLQCDYKYIDIVHGLKNALAANQSTEKVINLYLKTSINDLRNAMWLGCNMIIQRPEFELVKEGSKHKLYMLSDIYDLPLYSDVFVNNELDTTIVRDTKIVKKAEIIGKNYIDVKIENMGTMSSARFEYHVQKP